MSTSTHTVVGMTCGHCVQSVTKEVAAIDNVTDVDVDLATGKVTITSDGELAIEALRDAIDEAGYELAP